MLDTEGGESLHKHLLLYFKSEENHYSFYKKYMWSVITYHLSQAEVVFCEK